MYGTPSRSGGGTDEAARAGPAGELSAATRRALRKLLRMLNAGEATALAGSLVGVDRRLVVLRAPADEGDPWILLEPELESVSTHRSSHMESCFCLPGYRARVSRPTLIVLRARTHTGFPVRFAAGGELARALQHQLDHLDGVLIVDRVDAKVREAFPPEVTSPRSRCPHVTT